MQVAETPSPWSVEGFTRDETNRRIDERRQKVLKLVHRRLTAQDISEEINLSTTSVHSDIRALIQSGLLTPGEVARTPTGKKRWEPTPETVILISEMLRKARTYADIAKVVGVASQTLSRWAKESSSPQIVSALRDRAAAKKPKATHTPRAKLYDEIEAQALKDLGVSLTQKSQENRNWMNAHGFDLKPSRYGQDLKGRPRRRRR